MKYILFGAVPPPLGGVAVYCMRKLQKLKEENKEILFFDSRDKINLLKLVLFCSFLRVKKVDFEVEVNNSNAVSLLVLFLFGLPRYCVFYDHNSSRRLLRGGFNRVVFKLFCRRVKRIKLVNRKLLKSYDSLLNIKKKDLVVKSPFLPPTSIEIKRAHVDFPLGFRYLMDGDDRDVILTTAWKPVSTEREYDLYGILDSLDLYKSMLPIYSNLNFVIIVGELDDSEYSKAIKIKASEISKYDNFHFIVGEVSQLALLSKTLVLLRLTKTDGDSISIHEALYFGANVITTNVTERPVGVRLVDLDDNVSVENHIADIVGSISAY